jgi:hypothetical protein
MNLDNGPSIITLRLLLCMLALVALFEIALPAECYAALRRLVSVEQLSENKKYVLVILAPIPLEEELLETQDAERDRVRQIRAKYPVSGLYTNHPTPKLLWKYLGKSYFPSSVAISEDGVYAVLFGPFLTSGAPDASDCVAEFLVNGRLVASPWYDDLSGGDYMNLRRLLFGETFAQADSARLNNEDATFTVTTNLHEVIVYDLKTGAVVSYYEPVRRAMFVLVSLLGLAAGVLVWRYIVRLYGSSEFRSEQM